MLNRLQSLFNRLAGIADQPEMFHAKNGTSSQPQSFAALEKPACWRRQARSLAPIPELGT
jgi:hypothetical protein